MVLDEAAMISEDILVRIGALYHDIGKSILQKDIDWKKVSPLDSGVYKMHDQLDFVKDLLEEENNRFKFEDVELKFIKYAIASHTILVKSFTLPNNKLVKMFERDSFPNSAEDLIRLSIVCKADMQGHLVCTKNIKETNVRYAIYEEKKLIKKNGYINTEDGLHFEYGRIKGNIFDEYINKLKQLYSFKIDSLEYISKYIEQKNREPSDVAIKQFILKKRVAL